MSCFPYNTYLNCRTSPAAGQNWGKNGQKWIGGQAGEVKVIVQSAYQKPMVPVTVGIERAQEEQSFIFAFLSTTTVGGVKGRIWGWVAQKNS